MSFNATKSILNDFLSSPGRDKDCFDIHQLQGAMTAILSCPKVISDSDLGFLVLGEDVRSEQLWFEDEKIRSAWLTCLNDIDEVLAMDRFSLSDHYPVGDLSISPTEDFSRWCQGYLQGYLLTEEAWQEAYDFLASEDFAEVEDEHMALLSLLSAMADWEQALNDNENPGRLKHSFPLLFQTVNDGVARTHRLAMLLENNRMQFGTSEQTFVRTEEKIGRNDPCHCGSGKKYKKCCLN